MELDYTNIQRFFWFCQFKNLDTLRNICAELEKELKKPSCIQELQTKDQAVGYLEMLVTRAFPGHAVFNGARVSLDVISELNDWWKSKKTKLAKHR